MTPAGENAPDARYSVHSLELGLRILESFDRDAVEKLRSEAIAHLDVESKVAMAALADARLPARAVRLTRR